MNIRGADRKSTDYIIHLRGADRKSTDYIINLRGADRKLIAPTNPERKLKGVNGDNKSYTRGTWPRPIWVQVRMLPAVPAPLGLAVFGAYACSIRVRVRVGVRVAL